MAKQLPPPGHCLLYKEEVTKRTFKTHILKNHQVPDGVARSLILVDTSYSSPYWLMLSVDRAATLKSIDDKISNIH
jgi:hypothetical protein